MLIRWPKPPNIKDYIRSLLYRFLKRLPILSEVSKYRYINYSNTYHASIVYGTGIFIHELKIYVDS